jgi:hypothetical protein
LIHGGTFELKDPAAGMQEDQQAMADKLAERGQEVLTPSSGIPTSIGVCF